MVTLKIRVSPFRELKSAVDAPPVEAIVLDPDHGAIMRKITPSPSVKPERQVRASSRSAKSGRIAMNADQRVAATRYRGEASPR